MRCFARTMVTAVRYEGPCKGLLLGIILGYVADQWAVIVLFKYGGTNRPGLRHVNRHRECGCDTGYSCLRAESSNPPPKLQIEPIETLPLFDNQDDPFNSYYPHAENGEIPAYMSRPPTPPRGSTREAADSPPTCLENLTVWHRMTKG